MTCPSCGLEYRDLAGSCPRCQEHEPRSARDHLDAAQTSLPGRFSQIPLELLAVCALMALAGLLLLWPAVQVLPAGFQALGAGGLGTALGLLVLELALMLLALGAGLLVLAVRLTNGDRVARGLSYVLLGGFSLSTLIGNDHSAGLIIVTLLCLLCLAILAGAPAVRTFFTGPGAPHAGEGISVTVARTLLAVFACSAILLGTAFLPAGALGAQWVLGGVILILIGAGVFVLSSRLARGVPAARVIVTGLMAVYAVLDLITSGRDTASILPLCLAAAIVGLLWLPPDAREHFSASPAPAPAFAGPVPSGKTAGPQAPPRPYTASSAAAETAPASPVATLQASGFCGHCGSPRTVNDRFCGVCGARFF